jgi:hypothetical protein
MKYFLAMIFILGAQAAMALDPETQYLPEFAKDVTATLPGTPKISKLVKDFVVAIESHNKSAFLKLVSKDFLTTTQWDKSWDKMNATMNPALIAFQDIFVMELRGRYYVRFSVFDKAQNRLTRLPSATWYEVIKDRGVWKMNAYLPEFYPDGGP